MSSSVAAAAASLVALVSLVVVLSCAALPVPAERAELPATSPVGAVVDTKEAVAFIVQRPLIHSLNPRPIVDTMTEEERYGNTQQHEIGRKLVKAVEGVSNAVNRGFSLPQEVAKAGSRRLTEILDNLGGKLVGLQK